jgi:hypothetical protein
MTDRESAAPPASPLRIDPSTPLGDLFICTRAVQMSAASSCGEGRIVERGDRLLEVAPEAFLPLIDRVDVSRGLER